MIESEILVKCVNEKTPVIIYAINGFRTRGTIVGYSEKVIAVVTADGKRQMMYKKAISTIGYG